MEMTVLAVLLLGVLLTLLQAVIKVYRDVQILRLLRESLADCTPTERMRLCLALTQALQGATAWSPPDASHPPEASG
ncbi:hypothetical protein [Streptomyces sp. NPDC047123]|uniref:hypothetical protein n=1 Tax=Streptomyces sp. NPDC047123 TaxID=3155622 RepID=UPI0033E03B77